MDSDKKQTKERPHLLEYFLIIVLVLMISFVVLAFLGPAIGNTFSFAGPNI